MKKDQPFLFNDLMKVCLTIVIAAITTHFVLSVVFFTLGGRPKFDDIHTLCLNAGTVAVSLIAGWCTRRIWLVSTVFTGFLIFFLVCQLFVVQGSSFDLFRRFVCGGTMPLLGAWLFQRISNIEDVPMRPVFRNSGRTASGS